MQNAALFLDRVTRGETRSSQVPFTVRLSDVSKRVIVQYCVQGEHQHSIELVYSSGVLENLLELVTEQGLEVHVEIPESDLIVQECIAKGASGTDIHDVLFSLPAGQVCKVMESKRRVNRRV